MARAAATTNENAHCASIQNNCERVFVRLQSERFTFLQNNHTNANHDR